MVERVEAFVGEYAAGKSEVAINRALALRQQGKQVTLVDLDLVEPTFTLRPLKHQLEGQGLNVIAWETAQTFGLGEAGMQLHPQARSAMLRTGHLVCDVGYGVFGSEVLNLVEGALACPHLGVYLVVNTTRPMTSSVDLILEEAKLFNPLHGLLNNTHLGAETTVELVQRGAQIVQVAANELNLPVIATPALAEIAQQMDGYDVCGNPVWPLRRYLQTAFW
jgi:hypothetical protein